MSLRRCLAAALLLFASACSSSEPTPLRSPTPPGTDLPVGPLETLAPPSSTERARVLRVVDGDTVVLSGIDVGQVDRRTGGRRARLIGIDTPEVYGGVECLGREASAYTRRLLSGKEVLVDFDVDTVDRYGRALVYVWTPDGVFFNRRIVAEGFASPFTVPPNVRYADVFVEAAAQAREAGRGLWGLC